MKLRDIICETPLPSGWDHKVFTPETDFKDKLSYALLRAKKINDGSSRTVMTIPFEGRQTALKVASWQAGLVQNKNEVKILQNKKYADILIPLIDWDRENSMPEWIQVEKAKPITRKTFKELLGLPHKDFKDWIMSSLSHGARRHSEMIGQPIPPIVMKVLWLSFDYNLTLGDLTALENWGVFDGRAVLIDVGIDEKTYDRYY